MAKAVRCVGCGLLGYRYGAEIREASETYRRQGSIAGAHSDADLFPLCVARALDFHEEIEAQIRARGGGQQEAIARSIGGTPHGERVEAFERERQCAAFLPWTMGFTPKEHLEIAHADELWRRQEMRAERAERSEQRRARLAMELEEQRARSAAVAEEERDARAERQHWRELGVFGGAIGVATIAAAVIEGAISRGWERGWGLAVVAGSLASLGLGFALGRLTRGSGRRIKAGRAHIPSGALVVPEEQRAEE